MHHLVLFAILLVSFSSEAHECSEEGEGYNRAYYVEIYPDPDVFDLQNRTPLYFAHIQSLGGEFSQLDGSGTLAGKNLALDWINNDASILPEYTLHYTLTDSQVKNEALKCKPSAHTVSLYIPLQISRQVVKAGWPGRDFTVKFYSGRVCWGTSQASSESMDRVDGKKKTPDIMYSFIHMYYFATVRHLAHAYLIYYQGDIG